MEIQDKRIFPPTATRILAISHAAAFDALNHLDPRYQRFHPADPTPSRNASALVAAATALHVVAMELLPASRARWDAMLQSQQARLKGDWNQDPGVALGEAAARAMLEKRREDGSTAISTHQPSNAVGLWRPTRPDFTPALQPHWGDVRPFAFDSIEEFVSPPPPGLETEAWAVAYDEIKTLGEFFSATRTEDQTAIAYFWSDPAGSVSPPGRWNLIACDFIRRNELDALDAARVLALLNVAEADAGIACWRTKYRYSFWRPITAINQGGADGNPRTEPEPRWTPLITTPRFPEYTSGHSCFSGAAAAVLEELFGDTGEFTIWSDGMPGNYGRPEFSRTYSSFSEAALEASMSRIYGGIHYRFACEQGLKDGDRLGRAVVRSVMRPLEE